MKKISKIIAGILLSAGFATSAAAAAIDPPSYGLANEAAKSTSKMSYVYLHNMTFDQFDVDAYYPLANVLYKDYYLGQYGSAYMTLKFNVPYLDSVCLTLTRWSDNTSWYYGCFVDGDWYLDYDMKSKTQSLEKPALTKH